MDDSAYMPMDVESSKDGDSCGAKTWRFMKKSFLAIFLLGLIGVLVIQFIVIAAITDVSADGSITQKDAQEYIEQQIADITGDDTAADETIEEIADQTEVTPAEEETTPVEEETTPEEVVVPETVDEAIATI